MSLFNEEFCHYARHPTAVFRLKGQQNSAGLPRSSIPKAAPRCAIRGTRRRDVRFQTHFGLRGPAIDRTKELAGLKILFILLSNWDVKPENLSLLNVNRAEVYAVTDWGATMGRAEDPTGRSKWDCARYEADSSTLVDGIDNGFVVFKDQGKQSMEVRRGIKIEHVKWLMERLERLTDSQIVAALEASGATPEEKACFSKAFRSRLDVFPTVAQVRR